MNKLYYRILNKIKINIFIIQTYFEIRYFVLKNKNRVFLLMTPWYENLGDQAIALGEYKILKKLYPNKKIIEVPDKVYSSYLNKIFGLGIKKQDILFVQGGGNFGSLYLELENLRRNIVKTYNKNLIVIMPVSIFFHNNVQGRSELKKSQDIYNTHSNLIIISRDEKSFSLANEYFFKAKNILLPDAATSLKESICDNNICRQGIQFFLRDDKEKIISNKLITDIEQYIIKNNINYSITDTVMEPTVIKKNKRKIMVFERLRLAQKAQLVITDRYHGLIFSIVTNTPVIVFKSFDNKISSGIKWFLDLNNVHYIENIDLKRVYFLIDMYCKKNQILFINKQNYCEYIVESLNRILRGKINDEK